MSATMPDTLVPDGANEPSRKDTRVVGVISLAHGLSHFTHLMIAPLFPWLKEAFSLSYAELGLLMTVFFVVSGVCQALSGFLVDRVGPVPVLLSALGLFVLASIGLAVSPNYAMLMVCSVLAGLGNAPFHPVDFSIINARVTSSRLGHAYAVHGIAGSLGWAAAPAFLVTIATWTSWRTAYWATAVLAAVILLVVWQHRELLGATIKRKAPAVAPGQGAGVGSPPVQPAFASNLAFMKLPGVWLSFLFFCTYAVALGGVQSFGPEAARVLHAVPTHMVAWCLTLYMLCSAGGMLLGGFLVRDPTYADRVIGAGFGLGAIMALVMALTNAPAWLVPVIFGLMGLAAGVAGPSRDLLVKAATPPGATGRVYGLVYSGLDVGMAFAPAVFGLMMDARQPAWVWVGIAVAQGLLIASVLRLGKEVRRPMVTA